MCLYAEQVDQSVVAKMSQQGDGLGRWLALSPEDAHPEVCTVSCHAVSCAELQARLLQSWVLASIGWAACGPAAVAHHTQL